MHPVNGLFAQITRGLGLGAIDWFTDFPLLSLIIIVSWEWLPFALLILLTAIQSLDTDQIEAARMDGAKPFALFRFVVLPHMSRAIAVVAMIETIFFLTIFGEIFVTTGWWPRASNYELGLLHLSEGAVGVRRGRCFGRWPDCGGAGEYRSDFPD